jgi:hypothetical protein
MTTYTLKLRRGGREITEIVFPGALGDYVRAVDAAVRDNNGRKLERTIHVYDALRVIVEASEIGASTTGRQPGCHSYGHWASYVCCDAIRRENGSVIWAVGRSGCSCSTVLGVSRIPAESRGQQIKTTAMRADGVIPAECAAEMATIMRPKELRKEEKR